MERLQPDHRSFEPNPDAEDEAYDGWRQRKLDDETARDELRKEAEDKAVAAAMKLLALNGEVAELALHALYRLGVMDGALRVASA